MQLGDIGFFNVSVISDLQLRVIKFKWRELETRITELDGSHAEDVSYQLIQIADELSKPKFKVTADAVTGDGEKIEWEKIFKEVPELIRLANKYILPILTRCVKVNGKKRSAEELLRYPQVFYILCVYAAIIANKDQYGDLWNILVKDQLKKKGDLKQSPAPKKTIEPTS